MEALNVYSSQPASMLLACAFLNLKAQGLEVVVRPLAQLPAATPPPRPRSQCLLHDELQDVTVSLVLIGHQLEQHQSGRCRLDAGVEQGLLFDRDTLQARQRGLLATLKAQQGKPRAVPEAPA